MPKPIETHMYIRPLKTDVGRGPELHKLRYKDGQPIPAKGRRVPKFGAEGNHWRRRIADGGAEICVPPTEKRTTKVKAET